MAGYTFKQLNDKHIMFCEEYVKNNFYQLDAYLTVFKTNNKQTRANNSKKLLEHPLIKEKIEEIKEEKLRQDKSETDKWKYKRERILNKMIDIVDDGASQDKDKIRARRVFLSRVDKHEKMTEKEEKEINNMAKSSYLVMDAMINEEDLSKFENVKKESEEN